MALREAERAAGSGDIADVARLLAHRARTGLLARDRLRRAAWLGDEAAQRACVALGEVVQPLPADAAGWLLGVGRADHVVPWARGLFEAMRDRRAAVAAVSVSFDELFELVRAWSDRPDRETNAALRHGVLVTHRRALSRAPRGLPVSAALDYFTSAFTRGFVDQHMALLTEFSEEVGVPLDELRDRARGRLVALALGPTPAARA